MENNIRFEKANVVFNYRVGAIIKKDHDILIQKISNSKHITVPGGRCQLGEDSINTAIRELKEETGFDFKYVKFIAVIENFFNSDFNNKDYHELLFIHELEPVDKDVLNKPIVSVEEEKKDNLFFEWMDIDKLIENNFKPEIIVEVIKGEKFQHIINTDKKSN